MPRLEDMMNLTHVPRWVTVPTMKEQSVAEHTFGVAAIAMEIAGILKMDAITNYCVIRWALVHDAPESYTGDMPSPWKRRLGGVGEEEARLLPWMFEERARIPGQAVEIVKLADTVEAIAWISKWAPEAKWRHPDMPDRTIYGVLMDRIDSEAHELEKSIPGVKAAVAQVVRRVTR